MSLKLLSQCLASAAGGSATAIAASHNHSTADVTVCVAGARTEVIVASAATGQSVAAHVRGADGATALCAYGADAFLAALPTGSVHLIRVGQPASSTASNASPLAVSSECVARHPRSGAHFTAIASTASTSTAPSAALLGGGAAAAMHTYAVSRDSLFRINVSEEAIGGGSSSNPSGSGGASSSSSSVQPLGRLAGLAGLSISRIAVVPESPTAVIVAAHNRLLQIDITAVHSSSVAVAGGTGDAVLCPQRSWLLPFAATTTAATHITSLSVSGTFLSAGTSDGRVIVWDVRGGSAPLSASAPSDVLPVAVPIGNSCGGSLLPSEGLFSGAYASNGGIISSGNAFPPALLQPLRAAALSSPSAASAPYAVTSCGLVGAGTVFTTDARGFAKVWLRPSPTLPYEAVTLCPASASAVVCVDSETGAASSGAPVWPAAAAAPSVRCGAVGSRVGGNLVFATIDALGIVSLFGEQL